jgi:hypothetical protein
MSEFLNRGKHAEMSALAEQHIMGRRDVPGSNYPKNARYDNTGPHGNDDRSMLHPKKLGPWTEFEWKGRQIDVDGKRVK